MLPVFLWSCEPPANAGDGLADDLPQRLEQVEGAQYAERVKTDQAAALPAARTNEIHGERDDRKRRHADVEERPGPVSGFVLVEVVPPIDWQQREEAAAEVEVAERLDAARHQRLDDRRNERDRGQQSERAELWFGNWGLSLILLRYSKHRSYCHEPRKPHR